MDAETADLVEDEVLSHYCLFAFRWTKATLH